jgi:sugar phosphate isomerase/epimerase
LDTATIRPSSLKDKVRIAAEAGYDGIEPWDTELEEYEKDAKITISFLSDNNHKKSIKNYSQ